MLYLIAAAAVSVLATSPDQVKTFEQWWADGINNAKSSAMLAGYGAEFTFAVTHPMPPEGLDALRESVKNKPDHPAWYQIERLEKQRRDGPDLQHVRIWRDSTALLARVSYTYEKDRWADVATRPDGGWILMPEALTLKPGDPSVGEGEMQRHISGYQNHIRGLLSAGFEPLTIGGATSSRPPALTERGVWSGSWNREANERRITLTARGSFDPVAGTGKVADTSAEAVGAGRAPDNVLTRYDEWRATELGYLPHVAVVTMGPHAPSIEVRLIRVFRVDDSELTALTDDPVADKPDPIRGTLTFSSIRSDREGATIPESVGRSGDEPAHSAPPVLQPSTNRGLVITGWSLAVAIVGYLVWSFLRRK